MEQRPEIDSRICENLIYGKGGISIQEEKDHLFSRQFGKTSSLSGENKIISQHT